MGTLPGSRRGRCSANVRAVLAIELLAARRASSSSLRSSPERASRRHAGSFAYARRRALDDDRPLADEIEAVAGAIRDGSLIAAVESEVGELA